MTKYVVLYKNGDGWETVTDEPYEAANDQAAIKDALQDYTLGSEAVTFVAVPVRSWKPRKVEAKQAFSFS